MPHVLADDRRLRVFGEPGTSCQPPEPFPFRARGWMRASCGEREKRFPRDVDIRYKISFRARRKTKNALLEKKFERLADKWESETRHVASPRKIAAHPLARQIVGMGGPVLPLILRRMRSRPWFWFHALRELSGEKADPITPAMRGDMQKMTKAWIKWGEDRGLI